MNLNKEEIKNRIIYRAKYRGSKEMDILISSFVKSIIETLNPEELEYLEELVNIDDENLLKLNKGIKSNLSIKKNKVIILFENYKK